jgi:hypothetical protein
VIFSNVFEKKYGSKENNFFPEQNIQTKVKIPKKRMQQKMDP